MTLLSPPLMTFVLLCLLFILIFSPLPWLTLTSRLISWRTCHPLSLMISPLFERVISLWMRFCLLSVGWPDLRPTCPPGWQRSSLLWLFLSSGLASVSSLCHDPVPSFWWFSVVSVLYKVWALLGQWVRRFAYSSPGWSSLMSSWFLSSFGVLPSVVFSRPFPFDSRVLPPFYSCLLLAWRGLNGLFATSCNSLVFGSSCPHVCCPVADKSTKSCYLYLLSENMVSPHCVDKFFRRWMIQFYHRKFDKNLSSINDIEVLPKQPQFFR